MVSDAVVQCIVTFLSLSWFVELAHLHKIGLGFEYKLFRLVVLIASKDAHPANRQHHCCV